MRILYVKGHPDSVSFNNDIMAAFATGAAGLNEVRTLDLGALSFDPVLRYGYRKIMVEEPDLIRSKELVKWADHIVFAFPVWWGVAPSLLSGWIARVFTPGFAYRSKSLLHPEQLLAGKSASIIITTRSPRLLWFFAGMNGAAPLTKNLFFFTGLRNKKTLVLDGMGLKKDTPRRRQRFLAKVGRYAARLR